MIDSETASKLQRFRVPLGSLVVDIGLVIALTWWGATMQARFEDSRRADDATHAQLTSAIHQLQQAYASDGHAERLRVLENQIAIAERDRLELKDDITDRLERIEEKLERALR